jgi:gentisate 1,2-dioxygenase
MRSGYSMINGEQFTWSQGDVLALPSWALYEHVNTASEDAVLFSIRDRPALEALGENGGHQEVVGVFSPK